MTCRCDELTAALDAATWERDCALHELATKRDQNELLEALNDQLVREYDQLRAELELARRGRRKR